MYHVELLETTGQAVGKSMTSKVPSPATPEKCYVQDVYVPFNSPLILSGERTEHPDKSKV